MTNTNVIHDLAARQAALDPLRSFIVQAPAGSGKTGLLVYRYLTLLARVEQPQAVLAITFTRKATAEMRERLLDLLHKAKKGKPSHNAFEQQGIDLANAVLKQDERFGWRLLETPHQLSILTIDAFSARLSASMPWLSRLGDRPRPSDDASSHYAIAVDNVLRELLKPQSPIAPSLNLVLTELDYDYNKARRLFSAMLAKRDQWLRHLFANDLAAMRAEIEKAWSELFRKYIAEVEAKLSNQELLDLISLGQHAASNLLDQGCHTSLIDLCDIDEKPSAIKHWCALSELCLTQAGQWRKRLTKNEGFEAGSLEKEEMLALLQSFNSESDLLEALRLIRLLPEPVYKDSDWQQLLALEVVLKTLAAELQLRFRATGECDHSEVTQRANFALNELGASDLSLRLDADIRHILVDEFQDTSYGQIDLLKKLTQSWHEDRTLFLVGDPMQSIYRFREAEVSLFLQVANNKKTKVLPQIEIDYLSLNQNFRSSADLVDWFNSSFSVGFPKRNDVLNGAISYIEAKSSKASESAAVQTLLSETREAEAQLICQQITEAIASLPNERAKVAVLVRSRSQLETLLPSIREAGIDYMGIDIELLKDMPAIKDVVSLAKAICRADDRIAWLSLLRSPWLGLDLHQLQSLSSNFPKRDSQNVTYDTALLDVLESQASELFGDKPNKKKQIHRFVSIIRQAQSEYQQIGLAQVCRWAWQQLGGRESLMNASLKDLETVFGLIEGLEKGNDLPSLDALDQGLEGLFAQANSNAHKAKLVISTMHKAKGLQYHTVILPGLANKPRADSKDLMMWAESQNQQGQPQLYLAPLLAEHDAGKHFEFLRALESKRSQFETARLLYVASTRAEQRLILSASLERDKKNEERPKKPDKRSLLACIWPAVQDDFKYIDNFQIQSAEIQDLDQTLYRLPSTHVPQFASAIDWQPQTQLGASEAQNLEQLEFDWATQTAAAVGLVLHELFEFHTNSILNLSLSAELKARWRDQLRTLLVPSDRLEQAVRRIAQAIENVQQDEQAHFIFKDYPDAKNEMSLSVFENGQVKPYRLDRTFTDEQGTRWIIDYKSTASRDPDPVAFAQQQVQERHKSQLEHYGNLFNQLNKSTGVTQPIRLAVYFPLLKQLVHWSLPAST